MVVDPDEKIMLKFPDSSSTNRGQPVTLLNVFFAPWVILIQFPASAKLGEANRMRHTVANPPDALASPLLGDSWLQWGVNQ